MDAHHPECVPSLFSTVHSKGCGAAAYLLHVSLLLSFVSVTFFLDIMLGTWKGQELPIIFGGISRISLRCSVSPTGLAGQQKAVCPLSWTAPLDPALVPPWKRLHCTAA